MEKEITGSWSKSLKRNLYWWLFYAVIGALGLVYSFLLTPYGLQGLLAVVYAASNTWGLLLIIVLGGYGMAAAPRWLWMQGRPTQYMEYLYVKAVGLNDDHIDAKRDLLNTFVAAQSTLDPTDPDLIAASTFISLEYGNDAQRSSYPGRDNEPYEDISTSIRDCMQSARRASCSWKLLTRECMFYEDIYASPCRDGRVYWHRTRHIFMAISALLVSVLSIVVIIGQSTIFVNVWWLSPLAAVFRKYFWGISSYSFAVSLLCQSMLTVPIIWLFYSCYWSLTRLRFTRFYGLYPLHNTDSVSLMWCGSLLVRIAFPLVYNYLLLLHVPSGTVFQTMFGYMDIVPFLGTTIVQFFPFLVLVVALLTITNSYSKFVHWAGFDVLQFEVSAGSIDPVERGKLINEGKSLIRKERVNMALALGDITTVELQQSGRTGVPRYTRLQEGV
jgi:hypothetical protein